jgi:hypothetical protein
LSSLDKRNAIAPLPFTFSYLRPVPFGLSRASKEAS